MNELTWAQKLVAIQALSIAYLDMNDSQQWFVQHDGDSVMLKKRDEATLYSVMGTGESPERAVEDHWNQLTRIDRTTCVLIREYGGIAINGEYPLLYRAGVRWNGFMWRRVPWADAP